MIEIERDKKNIFVCYSHRDEHFMERVLIHLKGIEELASLQVFVDRGIDVGEKWKEEIVNALNGTGTAIILLSADSIASEFIKVEEFPRLIKAARDGSARIFCLLISPCQWQRLDLVPEIQFVNSPESPLLGETNFAREHTYNRLVSAIYSWLDS